MKIRNNTVADLEKMLKKAVLEDELDFERAGIIERKLRVLEKQHPELTQKRQTLRSIIHAYEARVWSGSAITVAKIAESDLAETIAEDERVFLKARKDLIKNRLQELSLSQKDLGKILGHTSISYMSELVNGINPFTMHDLIVIHLLLHIDFNDLIPTMLSTGDRKKIVNAVQALSNANLKINEQSLELIAC